MSTVGSPFYNLVQREEVSRLSLARATRLFSQAQVADALFLIEEGLVKITRSNLQSGQVILAIRGPGQLVGEESLGGEGLNYSGEAEVLTPTVAYRIPAEAVSNSLSTIPIFASALLRSVVKQQMGYAEKIELLCLNDVEHRILHYLAELSDLLKPALTGEGYLLPITQSELAGMVGATRETTSTTLNQLERRGLVRLSRRLLTISSPARLRDAALERSEGLKASAAVAGSFA